MTQTISAIILTFNEEKNLEQCLKSIANFVSEIIIVDCGSTDKTLEIAEKYNAKIFTHPFVNQAEQFNWTLDNLEIKGDWILKLDSDEYLTNELKEEIKSLLTTNYQLLTPDTNGFYIKRRVHFLGKWIKHGGYYPISFLRLWRKGKARSENRKMDEHIVLLEGKSEMLKNDFVDNNKNGLKAWLEKHKKYAVREAEDVVAGNFGATKKRNLYYKLPPFLRVFIYFFYRYFFRLGFLDGWTGTRFHFLHGFWYRWIVDKKILVLSKRS